MRVNANDHVKVFLNGTLLEDCVWFDVAAGEVCVLERHWSTKELVREGDGYREMILKGRVTTEEPLVYPSSSERRDPCYVCGGDCPSGCCQMCCLSKPNHPDGATCGVCGRSDLEWGKECPTCASGEQTLIGKIPPIEGFDPLTWTLEEMLGQIVTMEGVVIGVDYASAPDRRVYSANCLRDAISQYQEAAYREKRLDQLLVAPSKSTCSLCGQSPKDDYWTSLFEALLCSGCVLEMAKTVREGLMRETERRVDQTPYYYDPCGACDPRYECRGHVLTEGP